MITLGGNITRDYKMATLRQKELAKAIIENTTLPRYKRKNKGELLASVGYAKTTAKAEPERTIQQEGVQEAIQTYLSETGLSKDLITKALVYDIENKPKRREKELRLGAEILGILSENDNKGNKTLIINITGETAARYGLLKTNTDNESGNEHEAVQGDNEVQR